MKKKKQVLTKTVQIKVNQTKTFNAVNFSFSGHSLTPIFISKKDKSGKQNNNNITFSCQHHLLIHRINLLSAMFIHFKKYTWLGIISSCNQFKFTGRYFFKRNLKKWPSKWELLSSTFIPMVLFIIVCIKCSNFYTCRRNPKAWPSKWELLSSTLLWYCW